MFEESEEREPEAKAHSAEQRIEGLVIGRLSSVDRLGIPHVDFAANPSTEPVEARTTATLGAGNVGGSVVLAFEGGRVDAPIVLGLLHDPLANLVELDADQEITAHVDDERVVLTADKEIVLRCGKAAITLHKDGRILIRGTDLLSRSSGSNRVKGASVEIN